MLREGDDDSDPQASYQQLDAMQVNVNRLGSANATPHNIKIEKQGESRELKFRQGEQAMRQTQVAKNRIASANEERSVGNDPKSETSKSNNGATGCLNSNSDENSAIESYSRV